MEYYFTLFLKGIVSIIILYVAFNATFRYHSVIRLIALAGVVVGTVVSYFFIGTVLYLAYALTIGAIAVAALAIQIYLARNRYALFFLISFIDKSKHPDETELREILLHAGGSPDNLDRFIRQESLVVVRTESRQVVKKFQKAVENYLHKRTRKFGMIQYVHIIVALTLIAAIWRF